MAQEMKVCDNGAPTLRRVARAIENAKGAGGNPRKPLARVASVGRIAGLYGHNPKQNRLLAALPTEDYERITGVLELVPMPLGMLVSEAGMELEHVYFLTSSIVSQLYEARDGSATETAVIGHEGVVGVTTVMGDGRSLNCALVKSAGYGFRMPAKILNDEFNRCGAMQLLLLRYTHALLAQVSQTAVCNRHHSVVQQLCRWLLLSLDRLPTNEMSMTQELIGNLLGVRRESVADAAGKLQDEGLIHYSRGHISVLDRAGLEARACECYAGVKGEYDRLLPVTCPALATVVMR
ncbi:CRP-like cAMP-binding protein [Actimicrobium sp. GrIS 1.19]|uniref:Crp/Fnr family transcriptional regulator n=1 Tax=Actimicrobium sp. GrIS 1.19 TaxID=3071708 RepID=UPI002E04D7F8|nr:CRP-like cAMP-binding protein [Actimicrobium sp. GrIS 1.19]